MFGTFRFILALLVLFSHIFLEYGDFNYGCVAVVCFFMISGYVMTVLIRTQYGRLGKSVLYFYADRLLRIYPQYFLFLVLTQIADLFWYLNMPELKTEPTLWKFILNALIVPVNYFMFLTDSIARYQLIPAAWSLGLEEQFYWIFPFLILILWLGRTATFLSCLIFALAAFSIINTDLFTIRLLPGVIFIFMLGKSLAEYNSTKSKAAFWTMSCLYGGSLVFTIGLCLFRLDIFNHPYIREVMIGVLFGFPIVFLLSRSPRKKWDELLGHASYGIFLSHMLVFCTLDHFGLFQRDRTTFAVGASVTSIIIGFAGYYLVEKPTLRFRHALRKRHAQSI